VSKHGYASRKADANGWASVSMPEGSACPWERIRSGIRFMMSEMLALGLPDPAFIEHQDFTVTFRNGITESQSPDLRQRQQLGLGIVRERGSISTGEYCAATGVAERTGLRDLQELVSKGLLVVRGKKRGSRYFLP
jgi:ATP-dependent DNA helicase RecG